MKKILLSIFALASASFANAQWCEDIFISEYVEGTNNDKAIEIYNPTANPISLAGNYRLVRYNNGTPAATAESNAQARVSLGNYTIPAFSTFVYIIDKNNPSGLGQELPISVDLKTKGDALKNATPQAAAYICPEYNTSFAIYHNGNDALAIQKWNGTEWIYVDIFGVIGECPIGYTNETAMTLATCSGGTDNGNTSGWSDISPYSEPPAGYNTALPPTGQGFYFKRVWTVDHTLRRKETVLRGTSTNPALKSWNVTAEWDSLPVNTFSGLGAHTCECQTKVSVGEVLKSSNIKVYPIPAQNYFVVSSQIEIESIQVMSMLGTLVYEVKADDLNNSTELQINTDKMGNGVYFVNVVLQDNTSLNKKIVVNK